jgi:hypothetical protein
MGRNFEHRGAHLQPAQNYHQDLPDQVLMIFLKKKGDMYCIRFQKKCRNKILNIVNCSEKKFLICQSHSNRKMLTSTTFNFWMEAIFYNFPFCLKRRPS